MLHFSQDNNKQNKKYNMHINNIIIMMIKIASMKSQNNSYLNAFIIRNKFNYYAKNIQQQFMEYYIIHFI